MATHSFGEIYLGKNSKTQKECVVKLFEKNMMKQTDVDSTKEYFDIHKQLDHPKICKIHDMFENSLYFAAVMEHCGTNLQAFLAEHGLFSEDQACMIAKQLLELCSYLESKNIAHRDFSLTNLLIDNHFQLKLIDFSISCMRDKMAKYLEKQPLGKTGR